MFRQYYFAFVLLLNGSNHKEEFVFALFKQICLETNSEG